MLVDAALCLVAIALAAMARPWRRMRRDAPLWTPLFASLALLPWLWAVPRLQALPVPIQLSGACLVALSLGWPLAVFALAAIVLLGGLVVPAAPAALLHQLVWQGLVPISLALGISVGLRRWVGANPFLFILGRGFAGTAASVFVANLVASTAAGGDLPALVAYWLMAWGDAFMTGALAAIFVAYRPQWLATWSDTLYLRPPSG